MEHVLRRSSSWQATHCPCAFWSDQSIHNPPLKNLPITRMLLLVMNQGKNATCLYQFHFLMHNTEKQRFFSLSSLPTMLKNIPRKELDEQKSTFAAIKNRIFAPYFESEFSKDFFQEEVMQLKTGWVLLGQLVSPIFPKTILGLYLSLCLSQETITKDSRDRINTGNCMSL